MINERKKQNEENDKTKQKQKKRATDGLTVGDGWDAPASAAPRLVSQCEEQLRALTLKLKNMHKIKK